MQSKDPDYKGQCKRISPDLHIGPWCNGNTEDFGPSVMGSNPVGQTNK